MLATASGSAATTAALVIAAVLTRHSELSAAEVGLRRVGEVMVGCVVGLTVTWLMDKIWPTSQDMGIGRKST